MFIFMIVLVLGMQALAVLLLCAACGAASTSAVAPSFVMQPVEYQCASRRSNSVKF